VISRWERTPHQIVVYLANMKQNEQVVIRYRLEALYPLDATSGAARIYKYYEPEVERTTRTTRLTVA